MKKKCNCSSQLRNFKKKKRRLGRLANDNTNPAIILNDNFPPINPTFIYDVNFDSKFNAIIGSLDKSCAYCAV